MSQNCKAQLCLILEYKFEIKCEFLVCNGPMKKFNNKFETGISAKCL